MGSNPTARAKDIIVANIKNYLQETVHELVHKVTWPTWNELQSNTIVVVVASVIFSLLIFLMDNIFGYSTGISWWKGILGIIYDII
ncbi:preprotein translocase subunit SecE [Lishizhenia sp.]|uniref:preprotein translocase subunit SecE n=1 Tax=Lishizhenia sp. TaxID=2497594 RepID=UPI00299CEA47|nr:preprotein translocase subunit SecE [Lishizhenia sp.]